MAILKAGTHKVTVKNSGFGESQNGTPYFAIQFGNAEGEITAFLYLSEKAFEYSAKTLFDVFNFDSNFETIESQIKDKEASIVVAEEDYKGKTSYKVKFINKATKKEEQKKPQKTYLLIYSKKAKAIQNSLTAQGTASQKLDAKLAARKEIQKIETEEDVPF